MAEEPRDVAAALGFDVEEGDTLAYKADYTPPTALSCGLIMVPHGKTQSNNEHLFQDHSDSALSQLLPEGVEMARRGAAEFVQQYAESMKGNLDTWVLYRTPLSRTTTTADCYVAALREAGVEVPDPIVDPLLLEINQGSWAGLSVDGLAAAGREQDAVLARAYRDASFFAKATDGSGESKLDVLRRSADWLRVLEARHGSAKCNVLVFGHGTFQNCVELLLKCYPDKSAADIFNRNPSGGSHLRRGEVHILTPLHVHASDADAKL